ncbi:phosphotransferase [Candidatus Saccharibacteria bacterium]|nr:phosphotransferase [Candidatus Saccharibacteria bacterium]MCL1962825.1 phosphotransferase [Candidatus Saccharibacteria bacterium]
MNNEIIERALNFYGVSWAKIHGEKSGYRNKSYRIETRDAGDLNLIFFKSEPDILSRINAADAVSDHVAAYGLPVRERFDTRTLKLVGASSGRIRYARIYKYLPGATIPWEDYTKKRIKLLGWAMSDLHHAAADFDGDLPDALNQCQNQLKSMQNYFSDQNVQNAMHRKLHLSIDSKIFENLENTLTRAAKLPHQIPLHLDLVRGNVLYLREDSLPANSFWRIDNVTLTGLIDFEKAARGPAVLDLARTYAFLTIDCARKNPDKIFKYLISSGYNKRGKNRINLSSPELTPLFWGLVKFFLIYDFYKFLRHNPYEFLHENHHFRLTRNMLIQKNMIQYVQ